MEVDMGRMVLIGDAPPIGLGARVAFRGLGGIVAATVLEVRESFGRPVLVLGGEEGLLVLAHREDVDTIGGVA